ncbi:MAG: hypothetical protein KDD67_13130 [Ignavibacteriae bacterium]|nr:hypothetical protein [Ignavibacteriota bacterium]MCB9214420.1 hypothetical protein [Ignavibacteria bacterium]
MRRNDALYRLIQSMSKSEKRYFKVFAARGGEKKNYLLLFDAMSRQKTYDEDGLKHRFRDEKFVRQFSVAKNYLYNLVMRSLRQFHEHENVESRLRTMLTDVRLLIDRGLTDQALSLNERAIALAEKFEKPVLLLEALQLKESVEPGLGTSATNIVAMGRAQLGTIEILRDLVERKMLLYQISLPVKGGDMRKEEEWKQIEELIAHPLLSSEELSSTLVGKIYYHWSHSTYSFLKVDYSEALHHVQEIVRLLEGEPDRLQDLMDFYLMGLNNALVLYRRIGEKKKFEEVIEKLRSIAEGLMKHSHSAYKRRNAHIFAGIYIHLLAFHNSEGNYRDGLALTAEVERGLTMFSSHLTAAERMTFHMNLASIYFGAEDFRRALDHINQILMEYSPESDAGTYYAAQLVSLIVHFELENYCLLKYMIPSTSRYLSSHNVVYNFERALIELFERLPKTRSRAEVAEAFSRTRDQMVALKNDPVEGRALHYFRYVEWLESRIQRRPFAEIVRESLLYSS